MTQDDLPPEEDLAGYEALAGALARLAGAEITAALGRTLAVRYKGAGAEEVAAARDPVSEVDHATEVLIRARLADAAPGHDIIGEEIDDRPGRDHDFAWAIDPVDGTENFVNGLPLFAASIGLLYRGRPVVGAVWCSTSHALRSGVYSACEGGALRFDGERLGSLERPDVRRRLVGVPGAGGDGVETDGAAFEPRVTGSAAIECAFVAARLLAGARFAAPRLWDVAGGAVLVRAAGGEVRVGGEGGGWEPLGRFEAEGGDLARWGRPMVLGEPEAVAALSAAP